MAKRTPGYATRGKDKGKGIAQCQPAIDFIARLVDRILESVKETPNA